MSARRRRRRRRYELNRNGEGAVRGRYGFTARHVRCDVCQRDMLPQHVCRSGWRWVCGNCRSWSTVEPDARLRWMYADDPRMLDALNLRRAVA